MAVEESRANEIHIIRVPLDGPHETLLPMQLQEGETELVIDDSEGSVVIGLVGSVPPNGFGMKCLLLLNIDDGSGQQVEFDKFIPSARREMGGGLQILVMS